MEIKVGQIDGLGAFDEIGDSEWDSTFFYILTHVRNDKFKGWKPHFCEIEN